MAKSSSPKDLNPLTNIWGVKGQVKNASGKTLSGVNVWPFDKDLIFDEWLGTAISDDDGNY
jgi:hypothetical protein